MACLKVKKLGMSKTVILLLCNALLTYQLHILTKEYLQFKTVIGIERKPQTNDNLVVPAVSVCRQEPAISEDLIKKTYGNEPCKVFDGWPPAKTLAECAEYAKYNWPLKRWFEMSPSYTAVSDKTLPLQKACNKVLQIKNENFECLTHFSSLDPECKFERNRAESTALTYDSISEFTKLGVVYIGNFTPFEDPEMFPGEIRDSISYSDSYLKSNSTFDDIGNRVTWLPVFVDLHHRMPPPSLIKPRLNHAHLRNVLTPGHAYQLLYTWDRIERLEPPFDTRCQRYRNEETKSYCYWQCMRRAYLAHCGRIRLFNSPAVLSLDGDRFEARNNESCFEPNEFPMRTEQGCMERCRQECSEVVFYHELVDVTAKVKPEALNLTLVRALAAVDLVVKLQCEVVYWHLPRMNLIGFLSDVGGLFSLWLGASILTLYDCLVRLWKLVFRRKRQTQAFEASDRKPKSPLKNPKFSSGGASKAKDENDKISANIDQVKLSEILREVTANLLRLQANI